MQNSYSFMFDLLSTEIKIKAHQTSNGALMQNTIMVLKQGSFS